MESNTETYTKTFSIDVERANYHLKCKKRRMKRIAIISIMWAIIFIYLFTPLSKINLKVEGNVYCTKSEIMDMAHLNKGDYWWLVNSKNIKKVLESYEYISNVKVTKSPLGLKITMEEVYPIAIKNDMYVLSNNKIIEKDKYDLNDKIDELISFDNIADEDFEYVINKYKDINLSIREHFDKIEIIKVDLGEGKNYRYSKLYGSDEKIGDFVIKVDLVYLDTKFNANKYDKIIEEVSKNNVKYDKERPALIAYHYIDENEFQLVESFEEE